MAMESCAYAQSQHHGPGARRAPEDGRLFQELFQELRLWKFFTWLPQNSVNCIAPPRLIVPEVNCGTSYTKQPLPMASIQASAASTRGGARTLRRAATRRGAPAAPGAPPV